MYLITIKKVHLIVMQTLKKVNLKRNVQLVVLMLDPSKIVKIK